jgi:hypothetical protein
MYLKHSTGIRDPLYSRRNCITMLSRCVTPARPVFMLPTLEMLLDTHSSGRYSAEAVDNSPRWMAFQSEGWARKNN